jgi:hypothetical protein
MILNEEYSFDEVRYAISSRKGLRMPRRSADGILPALSKSASSQQISYEVGLSFVDPRPVKTPLPSGTVLSRLEFPVNMALFMSVWWMRLEVLYKMLHNNDADSAALRREWQNVQAMPKAARGLRTSVVEIILTQPVYAWVGKASPLFNKTGGAEQIYLPNLAHGAGPNQSDYARLLRTYVLPAV